MLSRLKKLWKINDIVNNIKHMVDEHTLLLATRGGNTSNDKMGIYFSSCIKIPSGKYDEQDKKH